MNEPSHVLLRPVISEKAYGLSETGTYIFEVAPGATKPSIRRAVESTFSVKVESVNTLNRKGKKQRNRRVNTYGRRPATKRAMVTLAGGDRIDLYTKP